MISKSTSNVCPRCGGDGYIFKIKEFEGRKYEVVDDCNCQEEIMIERLLHNSGVSYEEYASKNLDTFDTQDNMAAVMKDFALRFLADEKATGIGYFGKSGMGKTHICIAICQELTRQRKVRHYYFPYRQEIQRLKSLMYKNEEYQKNIRKWAECKILYIDDFLKFAIDRNGNMQSQDLQIMFEIINARYLNKSITIFSSEYTVYEIKNIDEALGSRIFEMINPYGLKCEGANRRFVR